jgi:hypothetical protein
VEPQAAVRGAKLQGKIELIQEIFNWPDTARERIKQNKEAK